jgi:D-3-phosphoglycerate dehydrogenase
LKTAITDCDHVAMEEETGVFASHGVEMDLLQCRTEDDLIQGLRGYEVVGNQYAPFTERVFANLKNLRAVVRYGVGVDHIDLDAASRHGVSVSNVPDYGIQEVAAHALTLMLALTRKLLLLDKSVRAGGWAYEVGIPIYRYSRQTIGIVGLGRIGKTLADYVRGLGMRILATDPRYPQEAGERYAFVEMTSLETLLAESDVVSVHCPLETARNLIGKPQLKMMKPTAYLINVARGGIVNEGALEKALAGGWIAGAACDVLVREPPVGIHPLLRLENFIGTPHIAWYSVQSSKDLKRKLAEEIVRYLNGQTPLYCLNALNELNELSEDRTRGNGQGGRG